MRTIDITTTQKVTIQYELATLRDRFFAWFIDLIIMCVAMLFAYLIVGALTAFRAPEAVNYIVVLPIFFFYTLVSEIFLHGQTLGKKALGIKVVKIDGSQATAMDYVIRWAFRMVDLYLSIFVVGGMLIASSTQSQRLGGIASNTTVIKTNPDLRFTLTDILGIQTLDDYEPKFPQIRQFSEQDMLLIKNIIARSRKYRNAAHSEVLSDVVKHVALKLDIPDREVPRDQVGFLKTLIRDYIVLTR